LRKKIMKAEILPHLIADKCWVNNMFLFTDGQQAPPVPNYGKYLPDVVSGCLGKALSSYMINRPELSPSRMVYINYT
jgi:hypothetical protein